METVIDIKNLSKRYRIGSLRRHTSFRDLFDEKLRELTRFSKRNIRNDESTIWALKDVSFSVEQGEVLGIIGRNGAGKSTLLKILSRITEPTDGVVRLRGRIASLLEVGTGFSGELTGRENIFLNGAILGMKKKEIQEKFDEIVAFSEVEKFLDTPLKRYSSGMHMRLAFAVAAHLEPEILLIDEVLAVGDIQFQRKCISKMDQIGSSGRTILFVSHTMSLIRQLCKRAILLHQGSVAASGDVDAVISRYEDIGIEQQSSEWTNDDERDKKEAIWIQKIAIEDTAGVQKRSFLNSDDIIVRFTVQVNDPHPYLKVGFDLLKDGTPVFRTQQTDYPNQIPLDKPGVYDVKCRIPQHLLNAGEYTITPLLSAHLIKSFMHRFEPILKFEVTIDASLSDYYSVLSRQNHPGVVFPSLRWDIESR
ncbi:MAG: ABC transporter ATP-binding protein [Bacteroidota bacterium]